MYLAITIINNMEIPIIISFVLSVLPRRFFGRYYQARHTTQDNSKILFRSTNGFCRTRHSSLDINNFNFYNIYIYRLIIILIGGGYPMRVHDVQVGYTSQALSGDDGLHVITGGNLS